MHGMPDFDVHLLMILYQSFQGGLYDVADGVSVLLGGFRKFGFVIISDAADKMHGQLGGFLTPWGSLNIPLEELSKAVKQKSMDGWMFSMPCTERTERGQVAIR